MTPSACPAFRRGLKRGFAGWYVRFLGPQQHVHLQKASTYLHCSPLVQQLRLAQRCFFTGLYILVHKMVRLRLFSVSCFPLCEFRSVCAADHIKLLQ